MSISSPRLHSNSRPVKTRTSEEIRQQVDNRHWQLFETRLKNSIPTAIYANYTKSNDYRVKDCLKKTDQRQPPIEPNRRWQTFCSQLTNRSNENDRLISIFHNVWTHDWNRTHTNETEKQYKTYMNSHENNLLKYASLNEHDKKVIASILHHDIQN